MTLRGEAALPLTKDPECPCVVKCPVTKSSTSSQSTVPEKKHQWFLQYAEMPKPVQKIETLCQDRLFLETIAQALLRIDILAKYAIHIQKGFEKEEKSRNDDDDDDDDSDGGPDYLNTYLSNKKEIYDAYCPITMNSMLRDAKKTVQIAEKMCDQWEDSPFARRKLAAMQAKKDISYKFFQAKIDFYLANMLFSKLERQKDPFRNFQENQDDDDDGGDDDDDDDEDYIFNHK